MMSVSQSVGFVHFHLSGATLKIAFYVAIEDTHHLAFVRRVSYVR